MDKATRAFLNSRITPRRGGKTSVIDTMRADHDRVVVVYRWPDVPGHAGSSKVWSGYRRATSEDGRYWEVRKMFGRWRWLPARGMFVTIFEVCDDINNTDQAEAYRQLAGHVAWHRRKDARELERALDYVREDHE